MRKLSYYLKKYRFLYIGALISLLMYEVLDMIAPRVTQSVIDDVILGGQTGIITRLLLMLTAVGIGRVVFGYIREYTFDKTSFRIASDIRKHLFGHIQGLSVDYFDKNNTGEIMARVKDDVDHIQGAFGYIGMLAIQILMHTVMIIWCMWQISPILSIFPLIALPLCAVIAIVMERKLDKVYDEISEQNAEMNTVAEENLAGVRVVKAFAREKFEISKFLSQNKRYYELNMRQSRVWIKYNPIMQTITKLLIVAVLFTGGLMVIKGKLSLGSLGAFLEYCANAVWPMEMLGWISNEIASAYASKKKLDRIYAQKPDIVDPEKGSAEKVSENTGKPGSDADISENTGKSGSDTKVPENTYGKKEEKENTEITDFESLEFRNVTFKRDRKPILRDISFKIEKGKTLGVMGATGAGKTTLINLMMRLYDPDNGEVMLNGTDIKELPLGTVRRNASVVMQDVFLFSDTIAENVRMGRKGEITDEEILEALDKACASDFIDKLEGGAETVIGERGVGLSGGQKQRISMARAIAKHAPVLVLDDSTSALDMETEFAVQKQLEEMNGVAKMIIAHRISAVRHADEIIVLDHGSIIERGTHEELLSAKGYYYRTYMAQYGEFLKETGALGA